MIDFETFKKIAERLLTHSWIFAKTMPDNPHWYTLKKTWQQPQDFEEVVITMREWGYKEKYGKSWYTMFDINGMKYWTMGAPIEQTILINRKYLDLPDQYDQIADIYDTLFDDPESLMENEEVISMLGLNGGAVLDIGCGSGLLLNYIHPGDYTGLDPSQKMLANLMEKYPAYQDCVIHTRFESFYGQQYDYIVSLFGAASYIQPEYLNRVPAMLAPGGRYFLMFYKPGYYPITYERAGVEFKHFDNGPAHLPGLVREYKNFIIIEGQV